MIRLDHISVRMWLGVALKAGKRRSGVEKRGHLVNYQIR
jgi:hypothetical protein